MTKEEFISKAREVHGDRYDYSQANYIDPYTKILIICPMHGEFWQKPYNHINRAQKCKKCAREDIGLKQVKSIEHYISKAKMAHGDKYDYSLVKFSKGKDDVTIICPEHGKFTQSLSQHILGRGCPKCSFEGHKSLVYGIGYNDLPHDTYTKKCYELWAGMLCRCYGCKDKPYEDCSVSPEWHTFSNFKKWAENPENGYIEGYHLDKDILVKGNKVYSPETCCFVPNRINSLLASCNKKDRQNIIGVSKEGKSAYRASITKFGKAIRIGAFNTKREAFYAYKQAKEKYIQEVAIDYYGRGEITEKVYNALMNYKVEITD